jgi:predicted PurR-regulated permease PerM
MKHDFPPTQLATLPKLRVHQNANLMFGAIAALYFTREILVPFAFALTLTFLLTPMVFGAREK